MLDAHFAKLPVAAIKQVTDFRHLLVCGAKPQLLLPLQTAPQVKQRFERKMKSHA